MLGGCKPGNEPSRSKISTNFYSVLLEEHFGLTGRHTRIFEKSVSKSSKSVQCFLIFCLNKNTSGYSTDLCFLSCPMIHHKHFTSRRLAKHTHQLTHMSLAGTVNVNNPILSQHSQVPVFIPLHVSARAGHLQA